jgi:hypothetical protein
MRKNTGRALTNIADILKINGALARGKNCANAAIILGNTSKYPPRGMKSVIIPFMLYASAYTLPSSAQN